LCFKFVTPLIDTFIDIVSEILTNIFPCCPKNNSWQKSETDEEKSENTNFHERKTMSYFLQVYQITKETAKEYRDIFIKWFDECLKINILHFYYLKIRVFMGGKISDFCLSPGLIGSTSQ